MWNLIILQIGIIFLFYGLFLCRDIRKKITVKKTKFLNFDIVFYLILFFIIGYIAFAVQLIRNAYAFGSFILPMATIVSHILLFGAIFVVVVLKINKEVLLSLENAKSDLKVTNIELEAAYARLSEEEQKMKKYQHYIKHKNKELEKTIDDFYSMRIEMERNSKDEIIGLENKDIKNRIDEVKS